MAALEAPVSRRRAIAVIAAIAGAAALPVGGRASAAPYRWTGRVLGTEASITLHHPDSREAAKLVGRCVDEIDRLESVFSLYRTVSELSRLNRDGSLQSPSLDFVRLLAESLQFARISDGAFDVSVQPVWRVYAEHFARNRQGAAPDGTALATARALVDYRQIELSLERIALRRPGMALTFNGIAQGYIADRVADLLAEAGLVHVLLDLGEMRALGPRGDGLPWRVGLKDPRAPELLAGTVELNRRALATSGGYGLRFDATGRHHHLFDPATARSAHHVLAVSVLAARATAADALSTALAVAAPAAWGKLLERAAEAGDAATARMTLPDGTIWTASSESAGSLR
jgi:thiamine biosynthesis lipoprotein